MAEGGGPEGSRPPERPIEELRARLDAIVEGHAGAESLEDLPAEESIALQEQQLDVDLKKSYAHRLFWLMVVQLGIADAVFVAYAWIGREWDVPTSSIDVWLSATFVEVVGIVFVVTRYLFPRRDA